MRANDRSGASPWIAGLVAAAFTLLGCASHGPQFPQEVATSFARDKMRRLETASTQIYYPEQHRASALRLAARVEHCVARLRAQPKRKVKRPKVLIYLTSSDFNNAYVVPQTGGTRTHMVVPQRFSLELFNWFGFGHQEVGDVGCHEAAHYVQNEQISGFWEAINLIAGGFWSPNIFTESWFLEGLATYYEGHLERATGRPHSPFWKAGFEAALAARGGNLQPGDLSARHRQFLPYGGNYLIGSHFVAYLAKRYGEKKLWKLVEVQGDSFFSPLGVTLRFRSVYGKTIGQLFYEFAQQAKKNFQPRERPADQQVVQRDLGYIGRLAAAPDGTTATVTAHLDDVVRLTVRNADGTERYSKRLTQLLPPRDFVSIHPILLSGMSFTADGKSLFAALADVSQVGDTEHLLVKFDAATGDVARVWKDLQGIGGGVRADGGAYVFVRQGGEGSALAELDLETGKSRDLTAFAVGESLGPPSYSPDGRRIAFSRRSDVGFDLFIRDEHGDIARLTTDGAFNYAPRWVDGRHLVFSREHEGRAQIAVADTTTGRFTINSNVPYLALDPSPVGGDRVVFLNRDGFTFTLDTVPLPELETEAETAVAAAPAATPPEAVTDAQPSLVSDTAIDVQNDQPYSHFDNLFVPTLHAPLVLALPLGDRLLFIGALSLQGSDRLSFHNWALNLVYDNLSQQPSFSFAYGNYQLAPWFLQVGFGRSTSANFAQTGRTVDFGGFAAASRSFWDIPFAAFIQGRQETLSSFDSARLDRRRRFIGAGATIDYFAGEGTPYGGTKRALGGSLASTLYLRQLGSDDSLADLKAGLTGYLPLPLSTRHNLRLTGRVRYLYGAEDELLQVGGLNPFTVIGTLNQQARRAAPDYLLTFSEPLRGYEDVAYFGRGAVIAGARYRHSLIIDRGITSLLYVLPSFFIRQVDFEAFTEAARLDNGLTLGSAGGAVMLRTTLGGFFPISFTYQVAARLRLRPVHYWALVFE